MYFEVGIPSNMKANKNTHVVEKREKSFASLWLAVCSKIQFFKKIIQFLKYWFNFFSFHSIFKNFIQKNWFNSWKIDSIFEKLIQFLKNWFNFLRTDSIFQKLIQFFKNWFNFSKIDSIFQNWFSFSKIDSSFQNLIQFWKELFNQKSFSSKFWLGHVTIICFSFVVVYLRSHTSADEKRL